MAAIDKYLHAIIVRAQREAHEAGAAAVEAPHLLLALAGDSEPSTRALLQAAGLNQQAIRAALTREFEHSLSAAGVSAADYAAPPPSRRPAQPGLGTSAKLALERGFASVSRKRDIRPAHVLLGVLSAQIGTVARALALVGIDRDALLARVQQALSTEQM